MWNLPVLFTLFLVGQSIANQQSSNKIEAFLAWFTENGGITNGVSVAYFPGMGNGIQATKTLSSETEILRIPAHYIFTYDAMKVSSDDGVKSLANAVANADTALACWVLLEKYHGETSFFAPYIDSLPEHVPAAMYFNSTELSLLQEPSFVKGVIDQQTQLNRDFQRVVEILHRQSPSSGQSSFALLKENLSLDDFKWATSIINSRGLRFRGQIHLAPFADFFNYAPHDDLRAAGNGEHFLQHHIMQKDGSLVVSLDRVCVRGEQCLEDYGDNPNGIYLQYHGFVPYNNPLHCLRVTIGTAASILGDKLKPAAVHLIKRLQLDRGGLGECLTHTASFSRYILSYLAIAAMDEVDLKQCEIALAERKVMAGCRFTEAATALSLLKQHSFQPQSTSMHDSKWMERQLSSFQQRIVSYSQLLLSKSIVDSFLFQGSIDEDQDMITSLSTTAEQDRHVEYTILALRYRLANKQLCQTLALAHAISLPFMPSTAASPLASVANKDKSKIVRSTSSVAVGGGHEAVKDKQQESSTSSSSSSSSSSSTSVQENDLQAKLSRFNAWYMSAVSSSSSSSSANAAANKISAAMIPGFRIGTIATETITAEEIYVSVPTEVIMDSEKAFLYSGIAELLQALSLRYNTRDDFHELLFFLLHEMFVAAQDSQFWPYLSLLPGTKDMDIPLFWSHDEIYKRLSPSFLAPQAVSYQQRTLRRFEFMKNITEVSTFFAKHKDKQAMTQENYFWATAIIDSRSIWWDSRRHLVPMLDFINCGEHVSREGRVHSTQMDAARRFAVTKAGEDFAPGAQVFENYGQANHIYFQYHGFALRNNSHDCIAFELTLTPQEFEVAVSNGGAGYLEQLGLSKTQRRWQVCLTLPINEPLWNILGLIVPKQKLVQDSKGWKLPNKPTLVTAKKLRKILKDRLQLYAKDQCSKAQDGGMLERFLCEEKEVINKIVVYLRDVIADLTEKEEVHNEL